MILDKPALGSDRTLDSVLTEFSLFVKQLCPEASVEITKMNYELTVRSF
jgi:hypothetical protein